ncbi:hypothetical protein F5880DRAFT_1617568 [Lentinula raphanica]|nr:hypothetical protein F5880DRAFT_1617568 [Lentinula raphanica]
MSLLDDLGILTPPETPSATEIHAKEDDNESEDNGDNQDDKREENEHNFRRLLNTYWRESHVGVTGLSRSQSAPPLCKFCSRCQCPLDDHRIFELFVNGSVICLSDIWTLPCGHHFDLHCLLEYLRAHNQINLKTGIRRGMNDSLRVWACPLCSAMFETNRIGTSRWIFPADELPCASGRHFIGLDEIGSDWRETANDFRIVEYLSSYSLGFNVIVGDHADCYIITPCPVFSH